MLCVLRGRERKRRVEKCRGRDEYGQGTRAAECEDEKVRTGCEVSHDWLRLIQKNKKTVAFVVKDVGL